MYFVIVNLFISPRNQPFLATNSHATLLMNMVSIDMYCTESSDSAQWCYGYGARSNKLKIYSKFCETRNFAKQGAFFAKYVTHFDGHSREFLRKKFACQPYPHDYNYRKYFNF